MRNLSFFGLLILLLVSGCSTSRQTPLSTPENIEFTILQMNDVYEIAPLEGGKAGGLARVATVKKELLRENPNTIAVLSGDFLSPSFLGTLRQEDGERIAGLQMVEALNAVGLDYVTFGNHEFDLSDPALLEKRINQSNFRYTVCNTFFTDGKTTRPFTQEVNGQKQDVPPYIIHEFANAKGERMRLGIIGVLLPFNLADYVRYTDITETFRKTYEELKPQVDVVVATTHLAEDQDLALAEAVPGVSLFLGGHDHENMSHYVENTIITKADANAKTVYIHRFTYNPQAKMVTIRSTLRKIDDSIPDDPATQAVVDKWQGKLGDLMTSMGYQADRKLMNADPPLICTEARIRSMQTNFGKLTVDAFEAVSPGADVYLINSGSMRLDDNIAGVVTEYDILRTFPYGGPIVRMKMKGDFLKKVLQIGVVNNRTEGGYFQINHVALDNQTWLLNEQPIDDQKEYTIVLPKFVAEGKEQNLELLGGRPFEESTNFQVKGETIKNDVRDMVIWYMLNGLAGK